MKDDDAVDLVFVTPHNFFYALNVPRKWASDMMRGWYARRDEVFKDGLRKEEALKDLQFMTFALNLSGDDENTNYAQFVIGWEHVLGMYIREKDTQEARLRDLQIQIMQEQLRAMKQGEDWKEEGS